MKRRKSSLLRIMFVVTAILGISLWINMSQGLEVQAESIAEPTPINKIFTDPALADEVKAELGKTSVADEVTQTELNQITKLEADGKGISSIEGIQYLTNLNMLGLTENQITNLAPLAHLENLESLYLGDNKISDVASLSGLTQLTFLQLSINQIKDVTPLAKLTNLNYLDLRENQISDASPLGNMMELTTLKIDKQQITVAPVLYQSNLVAPDILKNVFGEVVPPTTISNNGTFASPNITWNLDSYTGEVSYDFNQTVTLGAKGKVTFTGTVAQPITEAYVTTFDINGATTTENTAVNTLITEPVAPTKTGYTFTGWYDAKTGGNKWDFATDKMPAEDITLYAQFTINSYNATFDIDGTTTTQKVAYQALLNEPTAPTKAGYTFKGWYDAKTGGTKWDFATGKMPAENIILYAQFTKNDNPNTNPTGNDNGTTNPNSSGDNTSLPTTGDENTMIPIFAGAVLIGIGLVAFRKKRQTK